MYMPPDFTIAMTEQHTRALLDAAAHARRVRAAKPAISNRHRRPAIRVIRFRLRPMFTRFAHAPRV
ncbi:MAG: hypothetical protein JWP07_2738 [Pseudonocardiales bacterium]|jgi:hypothetical protein|nr:hypothetical protein [Pseudonocardiales bacterium]